jgi:3-hydroxyacyl-CoA dehydrogenase
MSNGQVRVAVVGTGEIGRGWAALIAAAGWPVALYDHQGPSLEDAPADIADRARRLVQLHRAEAAAVESGLQLITVGRSLLEACRDAQWVIEAIHEDAKAKQRLVESFETVAPEARVVSSSSTVVSANDLVARATRPERCMIVHPLNPPELIPLVEVVPGPQTDRVLVEVVRGWLRALGRVPVLVKKAALGNVAGRISAAIWREAIDMVLKGVIDVDDLDRAVSVGPALSWAAAGPFLTQHLSAGDEGFGQFFQHLHRTFEPVWDDLACWNHLDPEQQNALSHSVERTYEGQLADIRRARDRRLAAVLRALEDSKGEV